MGELSMREMYICTRALNENASKSYMYNIYGRVVYASVCGDGVRYHSIYKHTYTLSKKVHAKNIACSFI